MSQNAVLFYFWAHGRTDDYNPVDELNTPTFANLVARVDVVFQEFVSSDLDATGEIEKDWNTYIKTGILPEKLKGCISRDNPLEDYLFMTELMLNTNKRLVLERTLEADFNYNQENNQTTTAFFENTLEQALEATRRFLNKSQPYQEERERDITSQIIAIPATVLVVFGFGHPELEKRVAQYRPTEIHYPYEKYPLSFETELTLKFRETKQVDQELYLRDIAEQIARRAIGSRNLTSKCVDIISHHYAATLTTAQIIALGEYIVSCRKFILGATPSAVFESYLAKENLPSIEEVKNRLEIN